MPASGLLVAQCAFVVAAVIRFVYSKVQVYCVKNVITLLLCYYYIDKSRDRH